MAILGEVFSIIRNGASIKQIDGANGFPITRIETISNRVIDRNRLGYANVFDITEYESYVLQSGDILMSHINSEKHLGKTALYIKKGNEKIIHGMNLLMLRANSEVILPLYAKYFFDSNLFLKQIPNITKKSVNQASFTVTALKKLEIKIPKMVEQKRIIDIMSRLDNIIQYRKDQLEKLDLFVKSRFVELFLQANESFPKKKLGECTVINPKKSMDTRLKEDLIVSFVPMASVGEDGSIDTSEKKLYREVKSGFTYFIEGDVLFAKITPCMENGKGAVAINLYNGIGFGSTEFHVIRPLEGFTNPVWLYNLSVSKKFRLEAEANMTGSAGQKRTPASFLQNYEIKLPPIELQNQFADFAEQVDKSKLAIQQSLDELETLKKSLMQQYFG